jgi:beta-N-acetylhexosaminidase
MSDPVVRTGLEVLVERGHPLVDGRRIGLITNPTAVDRDLRSVIDLLHRDARFDLVHLYGPEHGVRGDAQAGDHVGAATDDATGLPVDSLYGETRKPTPEMLAGIDVLLFDIQDAGVRFYTYISTLILAFEAAIENNVPYVVLDRPNPITGTRVEGPVLDPAFTSFVGIHPIPTRHGLTMGELARLVAIDRSWPEPHIVRVEGWRRDMWWDETGLPFVQPSPNLPTLDSLTLYPGTCIFEGTTLSEGRGTTRPFEYIGAPWIDPAALVADLEQRPLPGVTFRSASFVPTFSKHAAETCRGVQVHIRDRDVMQPVEVGIHLLHAIRAQDPARFEWRGGPALGMSVDRLYGSDRLRTMLDAGAGAEDIIATWAFPLAAFRDKARAAHLYP